jgi:hypothetical protein
MEVAAGLNGTPAEKDTPISKDRLEGCEAIGGELGLSEREVRWALERGLYPARKEGGKWVASRAALRRHWAEVTAKPIDPEALAKERQEKNLARRKRQPSRPQVTMDDAPPRLRRRRAA